MLLATIYTAAMSTSTHLPTFPSVIIMPTEVVPIHDTPILGMIARPTVETATEYGDPTNFWVEYPSGLVDLSRSQHLVEKNPEPRALQGTQLEIAVDGGRTIRVDKSKTAVVVIDMQK